MKKILSITGFFLVVNYAVFAAEPAENSKIIYLLGESHENVKSRDFKTIIIESAAKGDIIYAMEALDREAIAESEFSKRIKQHFNTLGQPLIYGVEDPLFTFFQVALTLNSSFRSFQKNGRVLHPFTKHNIFNKKIEILCALVRNVNQKFLIDFWGNGNLIANPLFDYLKSNKRTLIKSPFSAQAATFESQMENWTNNDWINLTREIVLAVEPLVRQQIPIKKLKTFEFLLTCLEDFELGSNCDAEAKSGFFMDKLHLELRNDFIINNLEAIHSIAQDKEKPVLCILGYKHVRGVKKGLEDRGFIVLGRDEFLSIPDKDC